LPLVDVELPPAHAPLPTAVREFIAEAEGRLARYAAATGRALPAGFVPSDHVRVFEVLSAVAAAHAAPDRTFCEWGSGIGVVACLAAMLDFDAHGIEIDPGLVDEARRLAADFDRDVTYACGNFIPYEGQHFADRAFDSAWLAMGGADAHDELGLDPSDFGVVFAYPWPGDEQVIEDLFEHFAAEGSLLVTYHGVEDLRVRRKTTGA